MQNDKLQVIVFPPEHEHWNEFDDFSSRFYVDSRTCLSDLSELARHTLRPGCEITLYEPLHCGDGHWYAFVPQI